MGTPRVTCRWYQRFDWSSLCHVSIYRIYMRSRDKGRKFIPIGWYCADHKVFYPDKAVERNRKYFPENFESDRPKSYKDHKISSKEAGLRTRVKNLRSLYKDPLGYFGEEEEYRSVWPADGLIKRFLDLPPTMKELEHLLSSRVIGLTSQNRYRLSGWVPDPDKPGWMKYNFEEYKKLLKQDALKLQEVMRQTIESRIRG